MDKKKFLEKIGKQVEKDTGYTFVDGLPEFSEDSSGVEGLGRSILGQYISTDSADYHNKCVATSEDEKVKANTMFLDYETLGTLSSKEKKATVYHELMHAIHMQNNKSLDSFGRYFYGLSNVFFSQYDHKKFGKLDELIKAERKDKHEVNLMGWKLAKRLNVNHDLFDVEVEGFASWMTKKKFPGTKGAETSDRGVELYETLEKAYGFEKTLEIAMTPKEHLGEILEIYEKACKKLKIKPEVSKWIK